MEIKKYDVKIPHVLIEDVYDRLAKTRWPDEISGTAWEYGIPLAYMKDIFDYWMTEYSWETTEQRINSYNNFIAEIDGLNIHFILEKGKGPNPKPLILLHGWPSTFYEMLDLIPILTDPECYGGNSADSFDVIIPSIPGHGFSDRPFAPKFEDRKVAQIMVTLMRQLGYERFGIHAYDLGASISGLLCLDYPNVVIGYHTTSPGNPASCIPPNLDDLSKQEQQYLDELKKWGQEEGAYAHILGTKPQTLAYGLNDSPVGLAAFILEKWYSWTSPPTGQLDNHFKKEDLIANVMIYWLTETINSANRYYYEGIHIKWPGPQDKITVPLGVSLNKTQLHERPPIEYVQRLFVNVVQWRDIGKGGHFVALEESELVANLITDFFKKLD